jgi:hypothetical protein
VGWCRVTRRDERLAGWRLWDIGDWGGASRHLGERWEEVGGDLLAARLAAEHGAGARLHLLGGAAQQEALSRTRLKNPDALLVVPGDAAETVRAVDFKWSLETAEYPQIAASVLRALHEALDLTTLLDGPLRDPAFADGFFVAPDTIANRDFLRSAANRAQEYPLEAREVALLAVQPEAFFAPLPGWAHARFLATLDRAERGLAQIDNAERYYRLGVGLAGALARLATPIFADEPAEPAPLDELTTLARRIHARSAADLVHHVGRRMEQRQALVRRLRGLLQPPYRFRDLVEDLASRGIALPEEQGAASPDGRECWLAVLRAVSEAHRRAVRDEGVALLANGKSEAAALAALADRSAEFARRSRALAARLIERALAHEDRSSA